MKEYTLDNGHSVSIGETYELNYNSTQLRLIPGTKLTVNQIERYPDGIHITFDCHLDDPVFEEKDCTIDQTVTIYSFAMNNLLKSGKLSENSQDSLV